MSREYCAYLDKQMLKDMGVTYVFQDDRNRNWIIMRYWFKNNSKTIKEITKIQVSMVRRPHKYSITKFYPKVQFSFRGKSYAYPLSRFLYAWFKGPVPEGYQVDHIDNNPFNNDLDNLQLLTIEENLAKRYDDNPDMAVNQYDAMKKGY